MIHHGDCIEVMAGMEPESVASIVCDPPYDLLSVTKRFGSSSARNTPAMDTPAGAVWARKARGFMGKAWDGTGIAFRRETWEAALRVTLPGAHLLAFGGTRTYHRMAVAIEDAGWEIRDCLVWAYAQGFPKSLNFPDGWGTALKPAWEPIMLARKPLRGTVAANRAAHGTGGLNIDATRIPMTAADAATIDAKHVGMDATTYRRPLGVALELSATTPMPLKPAEAHELGRWPANLMLTAPVLEDDYSRLFLIPKADRSDREPTFGNLDLTKRANVHPTVKPTELMRHLVRLVTPSGGTVLDPFLGSGTTGLACELEGFPWIGIEKEAEYVAIAEARLNGTQRGLGLAG